VKFIYIVNTFSKLKTVAAIPLLLLADIYIYIYIYRERERERERERVNFHGSRNSAFDFVVMAGQVIKNPIT